MRMQAIAQIWGLFSYFISYHMAHYYFIASIYFKFFIFTSLPIASEEVLVIEKGAVRVVLNLMTLQGMIGDFAKTGSGGGKELIVKGVKGVNLIRKADGELGIEGRFDGDFAN